MQVVEAATLDSGWDRELGVRGGAGQPVSLPGRPPESSVGAAGGRT